MGLELEWVIHKIQGILKIAANDLGDRKGLDIKKKWRIGKDKFPD